jgi:YVTN family beta-propeller protein
MRRRVMTVVGLSVLVVGVLAAFAGSALAASGWTAYVADSQGNTVTQIDTATNTTFGTAIPVGGGPLDIAITPDAKTAYVVNNTDNTVTPISTATNQPGTAIPVGKDPRGVAITPDGKTAYVVNRTDNTVTPISTATNTAGTAIPVGTRPEYVAITPDGKTAYVTNANDNTVTPISTATNTPGTAIPVGKGPFFLAITPDGKTVYETNFTDNTVTPISIATNTAGTAIPAGGDQPTGVGITPDGKTAYVASSGATVGLVRPISIATNTPGTPISVGQVPERLAVTPDSKTVYVATAFPDTVSPINTATNTAGTAIPAGSNPVSVAITPDQAPSAAFSVTVGSASQASIFDGSASSSPVGSIASYHWDFGDGQSATTTTPVTTHVYGQVGPYTARLTVTNSAGTSLAQVFTGQTVSNQGGPQATTTHALTVVAIQTTPLGSSLSALRVSPGTVSIAGRRVDGSCVKPTGKNRRHKSCRRAINLRVSYKLTSPAKVTFTIKRENAGRKANGRCVKPNRKNRKHRHCTRLTSVRGKITQNGVSGSNSLNFNGKIGGSKLGRGTYRLTGAASNGNSQTVKFRIRR